MTQIDACMRKAADSQIQMQSTLQLPKVEVKQESIIEKSSKTILDSSSVEDEEEMNVSLQWPINILTQQPDCIRTCKRVWIACLSPLLTTPVFDAQEQAKLENAYDEDNTDSTIATIDEEFVAESSNYLKARALYLVKKIIHLSDKKWRKEYIPIVFEITQIQASVDQQLALDMARMGLNSLNTQLRLRGNDARSAVSDHLERGQKYDDHWSFSTTIVRGQGTAIREMSDSCSASSNDNTPVTCSDSSRTSTTKATFKLGAPRSASAKPPSNKYLDTPNAIRDQLIAWAKYGCIEPSVISSTAKIACAPDATSFARSEDTIFVLLGATAELGPFDLLSQLGANIAVVSRPGYLSKLQKLVYDAMYKTDSVLYLPVRPREYIDHSQDLEDEYLHTNFMGFESSRKKGMNECLNISDDVGDEVDRAGADIIIDLPEIVEWILTLGECKCAKCKTTGKNESSLPSDTDEPISKCQRKRLVIVNLASLLSPEDQVLVCAGMDMICEEVCKRRKDTSLCYYISPNTAHLVSEEASQESERRNREAPLWQKMLKATNIAFRPQGSWPRLPNTGLRVCNGIAGYKGHYYTLAKQSQIWRAMLARSDHHVVSANIGPSSRTDSMITSKFIRLALEGMQVVEPLVTFDVLPAKTLMAALMLYDLNFPNSTANPSVKLEHPMSMFLENAVHGGVWRCPYTVDSMGRVSYVVGHFKTPGKSPLGSISWKLIQYKSISDWEYEPDENFGRDEQKEGVERFDDTSVMQGSRSVSSYSKGSRGRRFRRQMKRA